MEETTKNTYDELLKLTRTDIELRGQFVSLLEKLHGEHAQVLVSIQEIRKELDCQEKGIRERLERIEKIINATYLHVSHLAESAIAVLRNDRTALDELRREIEKKILEQVGEGAMKVEAGRDVTIGGDAVEGKGK